MSKGVVRRATAGLPRDAYTGHGACAALLERPVARLDSRSRQPRPAGVLPHLRGSDSLSRHRPCRPWRERDRC